MNLFIVELDGTEYIREYEYANNELEALELVLGKHGTSVAVKKCKQVHSKPDLLSAARDLKYNATFRVV